MALKAVRDDIAGAVAGATSPDHAASLITEVTARHATDARISSLLFAPAVMAEMAGQLFVRTIEVPESLRSMADRVPLAFLDMPFTEAVEYFRARFPDDEDTLDGILDAYRRRASEGSRLMMEALAKRARDRLLSTLEDGGSLAEFAADVRDGAADLGIEAPSPRYLERVFRTQIGMAYGAGRQRQMEAPEVMDARPYVILYTVGDNRMSEWCVSADGKAWEIRDPAWKPNSPPRHYECRSSVVTAERDEVTDAQLSMSIVAPQQGFNKPPADLVG